MRIIAILFLYIIFLSQSWAQDLPCEIVAKVNCSQKDGIYLDFNQFIENTPIPSTSIAAEGNTNSFRFISTILSQKDIYIFKSSGNIQKIKTSQIWGFCYSCNVYINAGGLFLLVPELETLSRIPEKVPERWFLDRVESVSNTDIDMEDSYQSIDNIDLMVDLRSGIVHRFSSEILMELMTSDSSLVKEYSLLSKRKQKKRKLYYLNTFNQRNPLNLHK